MPITGELPSITRARIVDTITGLAHDHHVAVRGADTGADTWTAATGPDPLPVWVAWRDADALADALADIGAARIATTTYCGGRGELWADAHLTCGQWQPAAITVTVGDLTGPNVRPLPEAHVTCHNATLTGVAAAADALLPHLCAGRPADQATRRAAAAALTQRTPHLFELMRTVAGEPYADHLTGTAQAGTIPSRAALRVAAAVTAAHRLTGIPHAPGHPRGLWYICGPDTEPVTATIADLLTAFDWPHHTPAPPGAPWPVAAVAAVARSWLGRRRNAVTVATSPAAHMPGPVRQLVAAASARPTLHLYADPLTCPTDADVWPALSGRLTAAAAS